MTNGRELKAKTWFPSSRLLRTKAIPSGCRSFCFETSSSGSVRLSTASEDSIDLGPTVSPGHTRRA